MPIGYQFLLHYNFLVKNPDVLKAVTVTLDKMAAGGIYDQVGGGFSRYSTDQYWKVPHFEKMLYDNALLVSLYSRAYQQTKSPKYKVPKPKKTKSRVSRGIFRFFAKNTKLSIQKSFRFFAKIHAKIATFTQNSYKNQ